MQRNATESTTIFAHLSPVSFTISDRPSALAVGSYRLLKHSCNVIKHTSDMMSDRRSVNSV